MKRPTMTIEAEVIVLQSAANLKKTVKDLDQADPDKEAAIKILEGAEIKAVNKKENK